MDGSGAQSAGAIVTLRDLVVRYRPGSPVIAGISHCFVAGSMTAVTGPSGRGKSTLLYAMGLLMAPAAGSVLFGADPTERLSDWQRSRLRAAQIGFLFQDAHLDPRRTVLENIVEGCFYAGMTRDASRRQALDLMHRLELDVPPDRRPGQISGGQSARIALGRALAKRPALLLADEPTGNLDLATARRVLAELRHAAVAGSVVVIATHDESVKAACDTELAL